MSARRDPSQGKRTLAPSYPRVPAIIVCNQITAQLAGDCRSGPPTERHSFAVDLSMVIEVVIQVEWINILTIKEMDIGVEGEAGGVVAECAGELDDVGAAGELEGCVGVAQGVPCRPRCADLAH